MLVTGEGEAGETAARLAEKNGLPVFTAELLPDPESAAALKNRRVLAFAGIGAPEKFFRSLEAVGAVVAGKKSFGDHHRYTGAEAAQLLAEASAASLQLVTTEKDLARMRGDEKLAALCAATKTLRVAISFGDESALFHAVGNALKR